MNLAIVSPFAPSLFGVARYGVRVTEGLVQSGRFSRITVLANRLPDAPRSEQHCGLDIERVWQRDQAATPARLLASLRRLQPDVVWFNLGLSVFEGTRWANAFGLMTPMLAQGAGWTVVATLHEMVIPENLARLGVPAGRLAISRARAVTRMVLRASRVCVTMRNYENALRQGYGARNVIHIPLGTYDLPKLLPASGEERLLFFGSLAPYKGLQVLLDAFRRP